MSLGDFMIDEPTAGTRPRTSPTTDTRLTEPDPPPPTQVHVVSGGGGAPAPRPDPEPKKLSMKELAAQYGYAATLFKSDKELERLIKRAVDQQWTTSRFQAEFMSTKWYQRHTAAARTWLELEARDPSTAQKRVDDQTARIRREANQLGIALSTSRARKMARESLMLGWNEQTLTNAIVDEFEYRPGRTSGMTATLETFINNAASDFGVQVSGNKIGDWIGKTLRGDFTDDHLADMIRDMARSKYPGLQQYFDRGLSTADIAEPYLQSYAQLLELPDDSVTVFDPLVQQALQGVRGTAKPDDPPQLQTLYDFERTLRKDSRWQHTNNARQSTMNATLGILQDWGLMS